MDGNVWKLVRGEDFEGAAESMRVSAYKAASARSVKVRTSKDGDSLILQALTRTEA